MKGIKLSVFTKDQITLYIIIAAIVSYIFLLFIPEVKTLLRKISSAAQLKSNIVNLQRDWKNIELLKDEIAQLGQRVVAYEQKLPSGKEVPAVLEYLSGVAKRLNVSITEIKPVQQNGQPPQLYYSVPILLKAECGYHSLGRFINELERAARFMKISDIKITGHRLKDNIQDVQLMIVTYVMGQE